MAIELAPKIICVDFDGTCVSHEYPRVGREIGAVAVLRELAAHHCLILYTMRSGVELADACAWFHKHGIKLWATNQNPEQFKWTSSPKIYAHLYIDDAALGAPLVTDTLPGERPFVDWERARAMLVDGGYLE